MDCQSKCRKESVVYTGFYWDQVDIRMLINDSRKKSIIIIPYLNYSWSWLPNWPKAKPSYELPLLYPKLRQEWQKCAKSKVWDKYRTIFFQFFKYYPNNAANRN